MVYRPRYLKKKPKNKTCIVNLELDGKLIGQASEFRLIYMTPTNLRCNEPIDLDIKKPFPEPLLVY